NGRRRVSLLPAGGAMNPCYNERWRGTAATRCSSQRISPRWGFRVDDSVLPRAKRPGLSNLAPLGLMDRGADPLDLAPASHQLEVGGFGVNKRIDVRLARDPHNMRLGSTVDLPNAPPQRVHPTPPESIWWLAAGGAITPSSLTSQAFEGLVQ